MQVIGSNEILIDKISYKVWKKVIDININGMFLCAKYTYTLMKNKNLKVEEL